MPELETESRTLLRYFCTAGNGMELFLIEEVKKKLAAEDVYHIPGKVLFSSSAEINSVCQLKAAERLFLLLKQDLPVSITAHVTPANAASTLQSRLLGDKSHWSTTVMTWRRLQRELADKRTAINTLGTRQSRGGQIEESGNNAQKSDEENGAQTVEKKRRRVEEVEEEKRPGAQNAKHEKNIEKKRTSGGEEERRLVAEFSSCGRNGVMSDLSDKSKTKPQLDHHHVESSSRSMSDMLMDKSEDVENGRDKALIHPSKIKTDPPPVGVSFRISCKCTGSLSQYFSAQEVSKVIGVGLSRLLGWKIDLRNPQLEVNVYLSDDHCLMGIPLTRLPLANRCYIKTTGLRSTVAWAMASLAQIQPGFCVLDPMCGVGTILIEAAKEHLAASFLGMDIDDGQLQKASDNIEFAEVVNRIHLLKASSMMMPLPSNTVDVVVCDLPFGRKFGTKTNMADNLPLILTEMERVLCVGGTLVLLLSPQLSCLLKKLLSQRDPETSSNKELTPGTGTQGCQSSPSSSSMRTQTLQTHLESHSPPVQETGHLSGLPALLPSLKHEATFRVSLGLIDGIIHKYVKINT